MPFILIIGIFIVTYTVIANIVPFIVSVFFLVLLFIIATSYIGEEVKKDDEKRTNSD